MRTQIQFDHSENMFGHTYTCELPVKGADGETPTKKVTLVENHDGAWHLKQRQMRKPYYWFRAPKISQAALAETLRNLSDLEHTYELKVWHTDGVLDASLKIKDEMDTAQWAWSHTDTWAKWSDAEEKEWAQAQKPTKLKVNKDGSVKVKVTVSTLSDP